MWRDLNLNSRVFPLAILQLYHRNFGNDNVCNRSSSSKAFDEVKRAFRTLHRDRGSSGEGVGSLGNAGRVRRLSGSPITAPKKRLRRRILEIAKQSYARNRSRHQEQHQRQEKQPPKRVRQLNLRNVLVVVMMMMGSPQIGKRKQDVQQHLTMVQQQGQGWDGCRWIWGSSTVMMSRL